MKFTVIQDDNIKIDKKVLETQVYENIDKRKIKDREFKLIYVNSFMTMGHSENEYWRFYILLWKIV